jgi:hypothetical protein
MQPQLHFLPPPCLSYVSILCLFYHHLLLLLLLLLFVILVLAKLGSHGGKDFTKVMAISKGMEQRR